MFNYWSRNSFQPYRNENITPKLAKNSYNNFTYKTGSNYLNDRWLTTAKTGTLLLGDVIQQ